DGAGPDEVGPDEVGPDGVAHGWGRGVGAASAGWSPRVGREVTVWWSGPGTDGGGHGVASAGTGTTGPP
ncbi:hypothetical protein NGM37_15035, partial [Streptomyces sp. TRM76130]|nr:hypothetical protein [Streptomyces sp. TRM76130]